MEGQGEPDAPCPTTQQGLAEEAASRDHRSYPDLASLGNALGPSLEGRTRPQPRVLLKGQEMLGAVNMVQPQASPGFLSSWS